MDLRASDAGEEPRCIACGYDLRGLSFWGNCPECGLAIERSIGAEQLARAHPDWLRRMVRGLTLLGCGVGLAASIAPLSLIAVLVVAFVTGPAAPWFVAALYGTGIIGLTSYGCAAAGGFLLSRGDSGLRPHDEQPRIRMLLRYHAPAVLVVTVVLSAVTLLPLPFPALVLVSTLRSSIVVWLASLVVVASLNRAAHIVARNSGRTLVNRLERSASRLTWSVPVLLAMRFAEQFLFAGAPVTVPPTTLASNLQLALSCSSTLVLLYVLVQLVAATMLTFQARRVCRHCLGISEALMADVPAA